MQRILRYLILGGLGGLICWVIAEPWDYITPNGDPTMLPKQIMLLGCIFGLFVGLALGIAEALSGVSPRDAVKSVLTGLVVGAIGGAIGLMLGNIFYRPIANLAGYHPDDPMSRLNPLGFVISLIGRSLGWALVGAVTGLAQGVATQSTKKMTNGAVGGLLGGGAGGFFFGVFAACGVPSAELRLIGFTITGAAIGLFIGFIEEVTKQAWIVHLKGRNEGKEFQIFKPETVVGRDELVDIPVFGDPDFQPKHFIIRADQKRHTLVDLNTTAGTQVNGQKVQQQLLKDGDIIQVGMTKFLFRDKASRSLVPRPAGAYSATGAHIPTSSHVCPFCGGIKDASGNCSCSSGVSGPAQSAGVPPAGQTVQTNVATSMPTQMSQNMPDPFGMPTMSPVGTPSMAAPGSGSRLVAVSGPYTGQVYNLGPETTIGRQSDQVIALSSDNTVSRQHARVANEGGQFVLYDNGSANGTYVNNNRIPKHVLTPGDIVQVGSTKFRYEQ